MSNSKSRGGHWPSQFRLHPPSKQDVLRATALSDLPASVPDSTPAPCGTPPRVHPTDGPGLSSPGVYPGILVDEAVLPGEDHVVHGNWDEESAALAELPDGGGELVLIPRSRFHSSGLPTMATLAVVDGLSREDFGPIRRARSCSLRRVRAIRVVQTYPALLVEVEEIAPPGVATEADLTRLHRIAARVRARGRGSRARTTGSDVSQVPPDELADRLVADLEPDEYARLALLNAAYWPDRLPTLERLSRRYTTRRSRERDLGTTTSMDGRIKAAALPKEVKQVVQRDLAQSSGTHGAGNREAAEIVLDLVWKAPPVPAIDLVRAREHLDGGHFGLEEAKRALMDFLVTTEWQRRRGQPAATGRSLCLVGPPGTGKSRLLYSAAGAMGRRLEVLPLGGADDIGLVGAERTYLRSRPGGVVRRLRASHAHPSQVVFLLDELDKVSRDSHRSPVPVLLALLDPTQNSAFQDHFLGEIRIDLSAAVFVATANERAAIPLPLQDRLQFVEVPAYTQEEHLAIAESHLLPKLLASLGIQGELTVDGGALRSLVFDHPHSPGCRRLEQRLQLVVSRGLGRYMDEGRPVVVDAGLARLWSPPAAPSQIGFHATSSPQPMVDGQFGSDRVGLRGAP
ncbi:MAG TPA: AAA family ATPase [Candidatus Dormibacteraeota bacterium]|nr:AAA family ATPase [Candidatus Dormibacteraeota bacterium]